MKYLFFLLLPVVVVSSCHKHDDVQRTIFPYGQTYTYSYYRNTDSTLLTARFSNSYASGLQLAQGESVTMNNISPLQRSIEGSYIWTMDSTHDAVFKLSKKDKVLYNTAYAADVKYYEFAGLPDTVSISQLKSVKWVGPARASTDALSVGFSFSDGSTANAAPIYFDSDSATIPPYFYNTARAGKTTVTLYWHTHANGAAQADDNASAIVIYESFTEKEIWLVP